MRIGEVLVNVQTPTAKDNRRLKTYPTVLSHDRPLAQTMTLGSASLQKPFARPQLSPTPLHSTSLVFIQHIRIACETRNLRTYYGSDPPLNRRLSQHRPVRQITPNPGQLKLLAFDFHLSQPPLGILCASQYAIYRIKPYTDRISRYLSRDAEPTALQICRNSTHCATTDRMTTLYACTAKPVGLTTG